MGCWEETCLRSIEVEQVKLNRWMKSDKLYSEYVRLRRLVLRRLQEMQKVSMVLLCLQEVLKRL